MRNMFLAVWRLISVMAAIVWNGGGNIAGQAQVGVSRRIQAMIFMAWMAVVMPAALFVLGMIVGGVGELAHSSGTVYVARFILALGAFAGATLAFTLCIRGGLYKLVVKAAQAVVDSALILGGVSVPPPVVTPAQVETGFQVALGWATWFTAACLYAAVIPVYRNPVMSLVAGTVMLGLAGTMSAGWFNGPWARRLVTIGMVGVGVIATLVLIAPGATGALASRLWDGSEWLGVRGERASQLAEVGRQADRSRAVLDADRVRQIRADQQAILGRAKTRSCRELFCSEADRDEYNRLGRLAEQIQEQAYSQAPEPPPPPPPTAPAPVPPAPLGAANLAPPPPPPVAPAGGTKVVPSGHRHHRRPDGDADDNAAAAWARADAILRRSGH